MRREDDVTVDGILRRIEHMTGLTTATAEDLHVLNYGIGGHYDAHVDFFDLKEVSALEITGCIKLYNFIHKCIHTYIRT